MCHERGNRENCVALYTGTVTISVQRLTLYGGTNERLIDTDYIHYSYTVRSISNINIYMYAKSWNSETE